MTLSDGNPYLTAGGTASNFASSGSTTFTLYGVQSETISKTSGFIDLPMPISDSDSKIVMDLMGTSRTITIDGTFVLGMGSINDMYKYVNDLVGLKDTTNVLLYGEQGSNGGQAGWKYYPEILNRGRSPDIYITVYVTDVSVTSDAGNPNSIRYTISLMECDASSSA